MKTKIIRSQINEKKVKIIINLLQINHFLISKDLNIIHLRRKKVIEDDIGDKFALLRLIQVRGEIIINDKNVILNLNFKKHFIFVGISLLLPFIALITLNGLHIIYALICYLLIYLAWFNISKLIIINKIIKIIELQ